MIPRKAFILAAGMGKRLHPHTCERPKPLVKISGKPLLAHILDRLEAAGVREAVINAHYKGEMIEGFINAYNGPLALRYSYETDLLDTGGGIRNALHHFGDQDFFVINGDAFWEDPENLQSLTALAQAWRPKAMDVLMLLQPLGTMRLTKGIGDYNLHEDGRAVRSLDKTGTHMFTSLRINKASVFDTAHAKKFSYLDILDRAEKEGRLYGLENKGIWHHISTPEDLESVRQKFKDLG